MMGGLASGTGNKRAPLDQRADDLYETPVEAVTALLWADHRVSSGSGAYLRPSTTGSPPGIGSTPPDRSISAPA